MLLETNEAKGSRIRPLALAVAFVLLVTGQATWANCCDVLKVDPEVATSTVRVCEPDGVGACGAVLFVGPLSVGESQQVCAAGDEIVYQEWDDVLSDFGPLTTAVCEEHPVEI